MAMNSDIERIRGQLEALSAMDALRMTLPHLRRAEVCQGDNAANWSVQFAMDWLQKSDEERRLLALEEADKLKYEGVAGLIYAAVGWSRGSMVDPKVSDLKAPEDLSSKATAGAMLTALAGESDDARKQALVAALMADLTHVAPT